MLLLAILHGFLGTVVLSGAEIIPGDANQPGPAAGAVIIYVIGAIFLVYAVMASLFESLVDPFIIMFTFPLAIIGVIWMMFFSGTIFSIIAFIGVIMLAGIVVNNAIVMVDYINQLRDGGMERIRRIRL